MAGTRLGGRDIWDRPGNRSGPRPAPRHLFRLLCVVEWPEEEGTLEFELDFEGYALPARGDTLLIYGVDMRRFRIKDIEHAAGPAAQTLLELVPLDPISREALKRELNIHAVENNLAGPAV